MLKWWTAAGCQVTASLHLGRKAFLEEGSYHSISLPATGKIGVFPKNPRFLVEVAGKVTLCHVTLDQRAKNTC
jgi:hypothetical protein